MLALQFALILWFKVAMKKGRIAYYKVETACTILICKVLQTDLFKMETAVGEQWKTFSVFFCLRDGIRIHINSNNIWNNLIFC